MCRSLTILATSKTSTYVFAMEKKEGIADASSVGTFPLSSIPGSEEDNSGRGAYSCTFCGRLLKTECDCLKYFPLWLATSIQEELSGGLLKNSVEDYLQQAEKKKREKEGKISKRQEQGEGPQLKRVEGGYACGVCGYEKKTEHVCGREKIPRALLEQIGQELPSTFEHMQLVRTFLARKVKESSDQLPPLSAAPASIPSSSTQEAATGADIEEDTTVGV